MIRKGFEIEMPAGERHAADRAPPHPQAQGEWDGQVCSEVPHACYGCLLIGHLALRHAEVSPLFPNPRPRGPAIG